MSRRSIHIRAIAPRPPCGPRERRALLALLLAALAAGGCAGFAPRAPAERPATAPAVDPVRALAEADAAYAAEDWSRAEEGYRAAARAAGSDPLPWFKLGNVYFRSGRHALAAESYEQAVRIAPDHAKAWHNLGVARLHQADASLARAVEVTATDDPATAASARKLRETIAGAIAPPGAPAP